MILTWYAKKLIGLLECHLLVALYNGMAHDWFCAMVVAKAINKAHHCWTQNKTIPLQYCLKEPPL